METEMNNRATCEETEAHLQEFMDSTLTPDRLGRLRAHLEACPVCAGELAIQRQIRNRVAAEAPRREPPAELRRKVKEILAPEAKEAPTLRLWPALRWAMAFAALAVISLASFAVLNLSRERVLPILIEAVNDHRSFVMRGTPPAEPTTDRHQVQNWLATKVGFDFEPPVAQGTELQLLGGDVTYFLERKVACLLYGKEEMLVSLFVLPYEGIEVPRTGYHRMDGLDVYVTSQDGYGVALWKKGSLLYSLVTELPPDELLRVATHMART